MPWTDSALIQNPNIVFVFKDLQIAEVSVDYLLRLFLPVRPFVQTDPDGTLTLVYPFETDPLACNIGNRRLLVAGNDLSASERMIKILSEYKNFLPKDMELSAYGYNFRFFLVVEHGDHKVYRAFLKSPEVLESTFSGSIDDFELGIAFARPENRLQFKFTPAINNISVSVNIHFEASEVPSAERLREEQIHWKNICLGYIDEVLT